MSKSKRIAISDQMAKRVHFARFAAETGIDPADLAQLLTLARRAFSAGERECNTGRSGDAARDRFELFAGDLGYKVRWPGLWPQINAGGKFFNLPEV